jgi:hypothetical protein
VRGLNEGTCFLPRPDEDAKEVFPMQKQKTNDQNTPGIETLGSKPHKERDWMRRQRDER